MTEWNLWHSIDLLLLLQRINCVSPFYLDRERNALKVSAFTRFYLWSALITFLFTSYVLLFRWNCFGIILTFLPPGYLWTILAGYEILYSNAQFILNVILVDAGKWQQMEFLHKINDIDRRLADTFHMCVDFCRYRQRIFYATISFLLYFYGFTIGLCYLAHSYGNYRLLLFVLTYQFVQMSLANTVFAAINSAFLIRDRFKLLTTIYQHTNRDLGYNFTANDKQQFLVKIQMIFCVFKELCDLIKLLDEYSGWNYILSLVQDFTLPLIRWYFTFYILWEDGIECNGVYVGITFVWSIGTLSKSGLGATAINMTITQANRCKQAFKTLDKNRIDKDIMQLSDHFQLWSFHRRIEFTARDFVVVDNAYNFSTFGAMVTYLIILIQFKMQEDELVASSSNENENKSTAIYQ